MDICPNLIGGKNWQPMCYSPQTGLVYIPSFNMCMDIENAEPAYKPGKFYLAFEFDLGKSGPGGVHERVHRVGSRQAAEGVGHQGRAPLARAAR